MTQILIVEDDQMIRAPLQLQLREEGFGVVAVSTGEEALAALERSEPADRYRPDLMLVDIRLPGLSGVDLVGRLAEAGRLPPTIIVSGEASISETVAALKLGVHDFIEKPFTRERLLRSIQNTLDHATLSRQVTQLRSELAGAGEILGHSPVIEALREQVARAAPIEARVLILGETGTGKELVADALHRFSERRNRPFVKLNCAAIAPQLVESELFGHAKGAFTDARADKPGLFEAADGGTLFLDEIGDMDPRLQARLLRVLEDGRVRRVGEARERAVDVRVIAATHADLERGVEDGSFREDLYFRLAHLPIEVPPLRRRDGDVPLLLEHFVAQLAIRHRRRPLGIDPDLPRRLEPYRWPGNVRELRSLCERLVVFGGDPLEASMLPARYLRGAPEAGHEELLMLRPGQPVVALRRMRHRAEKEYIEWVLERTGWSVTAAAGLLDIQRTHLHQRMRDLGIRRPQREPV